MSWTLQLKSFLNLQDWNHSLSLVAGSRNSLLPKREKWKEWLPAFTCTGHGTDPHSQCSEPPLLSHSSSRTLSSLVQLFSECFCTIQTHELERLSIRENAFEHTWSCAGLSWFSFTATKLNLGLGSQVQPGYRERAQNAQVPDCIDTWVSYQCY